MSSNTNRKSRAFQPVTSAAMQAALRRIAERHGYLTTRGPLAGQGNPSAFIQALDGGEVATVMLDSDQRWEVITALRTYADQRNDWMSEPIRDVADQLAAAARREEELDQEELREYMRDA